MIDILLTIGFSALVFVGILMVFVPFLPAIFYMFAISVIYGIIGGFAVITPWQLVILGGILLLGFINDMLSGILGAKWSGASKKSMLYGFIGLLVGTIILPPLGGIAGLFIGILFAEFSLGKSHQKAFKAATGSLIGTVAGMIINFILAIAFFVLFVIFVLV